MMRAGKEEVERFLSPISPKQREPQIALTVPMKTAKRRRSSTVRVLQLKIPRVLLLVPIDISTSHRYNLASPETVQISRAPKLSISRLDFDLHLHLPSHAAM